MEREHGVPYVKWMLLNAFCDRNHNVLSRVRYRNILIADPLKMDKLAVLPAKPPTVEVMVFCLDTTSGSYWIEEGKHPVIGLPRLRTRSTVFDDTAAFAKAIWENHPDPYAAADEAVTPAGEKPGLADLQQRAEEVGPLQMPSPTDIDDLPDDKRREVLQAIADLKQISKQGKT
jgi:hypothetical protein